MLGVANSGAIVAGGASAPSADGAVRVRALLSFWYAGEPLPIGHEMAMTARQAREYRNAGRVEILPDVPAPAPDEAAEAEAAAKTAEEAEAAKAAAEAEAAKEAEAARRSTRKDLIT